MQTYEIRLVKGLPKIFAVGTNKETNGRVREISFPHATMSTPQGDVTYISGPATGTIDVNMETIHDVKVV